MSDPNLPPRDDRPNVHTTINTPAPRRGGGSTLAFIVGGLLVLVAVIAFFLYTGRTTTPELPSADIDVDIRAPQMPDVPTPQAPPSTDAPA